jgi:hypothetical protein
VRWKKVIHNTRHYAITVDGWSTFTHTGFLALTYHAIPKYGEASSQWKLKSFLLEVCEVTQESEDSDSIARIIDDILTRWSLKKENCVMATTDGAPVMPLAIRKLGLPWMHCAAHGVNLAVEKGFEVKEAEAILTTIRGCVSYFDKHPKHMRVLRKKQGVLDNQPTNRAFLWSRIARHVGIQGFT